MRHFTRTPCYSGPDDPERGQPRGTLELGETVIIDTVGGSDHDYEAAGETRAGQITAANTTRHSRALCVAYQVRLDSRFHCFC